MSKLPKTLLVLLAGAIPAGIIAAGTIAGPAIAAPGDIILSATLGNASETPPTSGNATGMFMGRLNPASGQLCYTLTSQNLSDLTMAHIHVGAPGVAGPPVVVLSPNVPSESCIPVDKAVAEKLVAHPGDYYVNIHNTAYPKGAIRGQLAPQ